MVPAIALTLTIQRTRWRVAYDTDGWPSETITFDATEEYDAQETTMGYMAVRDLGYWRQRRVCFGVNRASFGISWGDRF